MPRIVDFIDELNSALLRLDRSLELALTSFEATQGGPINDRFRGLYITQQQVVSELSRHPGSGAFCINSPALEPLWPAEEGSIAAWLAETFKLSAFELDILLIAIAPEYDLRYERIFAYLQDDVTRKRPTVDLALNLLTFTPAQRFAARPAFAADSPLRRGKLLQLFSDPQHPHAPLLAQNFRMDAQVLHHLLGDTGFDERLKPNIHLHATSVTMEKLHVTDETQSQLARLVEALRSGRHGWLHGMAGIGKAETAGAIARELDTILIALDAHGIATSEAVQIMTLSAREAWLRSGMLYVGNVDDWLLEPATVRCISAILEEAHVPIIFGSEKATPTALLAQVMAVELPPLNMAGQALCWQASLVQKGAHLDSHELEKLAGLFQLTPAQIECATVQAVSAAGPQPSMDGTAGATFPLEFDYCAAAARRQSAHLLLGLAEKVDAIATWEDIILADDGQAQLKELCQRVEYRHKVLHQWGFARHNNRGLGTSALFAGPSGTGKTMAAEVVANALGLDLYRIDLAGVVSKYIGETEKNLDRIFTAASHANAILFFDEADALFGKRSEVRDSHDRYANLEISYLLQKMEQYPGITILATNLRQNLDEAFLRRLAFIIQFPFPDEAMRRRIWQAVWPESALLADDVDLDEQAREFKLAGGAIRNIALAAGFLAAEEKTAIGRRHIQHVAHRELQKHGKATPAMVANPAGGASI